MEFNMERPRRDVDASGGQDRSSTTLTHTRDAPHTRTVRSFAGDVPPPPGSKSGKSACSQELRARGVRIEHAAEQLEPRTTHTPLMKQILPW